MTTYLPSSALARRAAFALALAAALAGCSVFRDKTPKPEDMTATQIYDLGEKDMKAANYKAAAKNFDEIERLYPFSELSKRAIIMSAFASYKGREMSDARASAQRYLDLYPSDSDAPYAAYLIALTYYDDIVDVGRDQDTTRKALDALNTVVQRYPQSDYARDAKLKIDLSRDHLAGKEMAVGRYYLKRGDYQAAIARFRTVVDKYPTTSQTPEALHRLVEAYSALGLTREAKEAAVVLGTNYPGSQWYSDSYADVAGKTPPDDKGEGGVFSSLYRQIILGRWL